MTGIEVAIIALDCIAPDANNAEMYFTNLLDGKLCTHFLEDEELIKAGVPEGHLKNSNYVRSKGRIDLNAVNELSLSSVDTKLCQYADPQLKLLVRCTDSVVSDFCESSKNERNVGIFIGTSSGFEWRKEIYKSISSSEVFLRNQLSYLTEEGYYATQIAYRNNFTGPSQTIMAACASSSLAIHFACRSLLAGECKIAIAGGVSAISPINGGYFYEENTMYSKTGICRPFDKNADGAVPGSGVGILALKLLDAAIDDNDDIVCVIKATNANNDGNQKIGYAAPGMGGQTSVISEAIEIAAETLPDEYDFLEAHGTGTLLGDCLEVEAIKRALPTNNMHCALGSVKGNIGYLDAASGVMGVIKSALAIKHRKFPANINFEQINPDIDLSNSGLFIPVDNVDLSQEKVIGGINSFGDGGTNVHIILESF